MKINKKLHSVALVSVALILFLILVSSASSASPKITETQITTSGSASNPDISGNKIVWQDSRLGNEKSDIYMYDIFTKKETQITNNGSNHYSPVIYRNKVAWMEWYVNPVDLVDGGFYMQDISTKKQRLIMTFSDLVDNSAIYGDKIVFEIYNVASPGVYIYSLSTSKLETISESAFYPAIYGNKIVSVGYQDGIPGDGSDNIYIYDLSAKKQIQITTSGLASNPAIYKNKVVWQDSRNGNLDIYMYDISTRKETQITTNSSDSENPVVYGNSIVWQDNRNGNWDIYAYDLITHQQIHTTNKSDQVEPSIDNNKVVWQDNRNGKSDIYMGALKYK